jgi:hypothetical protein
MRITTKLRVSLKTDHIKKRYKAGRDKSLDRIGSILRRAARDQMLNKTPKKSTTKWRRVGEQDGIPVAEVTFRNPTAGRVTSWKTGRGRAAKGFLRSSIRYERDDAKGSVVIGPAENVVWLNKIQEFGGSRPVVWRFLSAAPIDKLKSGQAVPRDIIGGGGRGGRDGRGRFTRGSGGGAYVVIRTDAQTGRKTKAGTFKQESGKVKPGRYMAGGLKKIRTKIPKSFQNFIQGP